MKRKIIPVGIAGIFAGLFLFLVLFTRGCVFNLIPYMLHERITTTGAGESAFVEEFDVAFAILMFWIVYLLIRWVMKDGGQGVK